MRHWRALDGLRGVAIVLVMGQHFELPGFTHAGEVGVTLFFVLSGFLITSLLLTEWADHGRIRFGDFYRRRAVRLLPALFVMLAVVAPLMVLAGYGLAQDVVPAVLYYANWAQVVGPQIPVVGHTWSLSIEEQFYIVWPAVVLVLVVSFRGIRWPVAILCAGAVLAMAARVVFWHPTESTFFRIFYGSDTRADALLLGCALAFVFSRVVWRPPKWLTAVAVAGGVLSMVTVSVSFLAVVGLSAAALASVVLVAAARTQVGGLLEWKPLVWTGTVSYSLYLWHVPILSLIGATALGHTALGSALALGLSVIAAVLSRRFVELPALRWRSRVRLTREPLTEFGT
jgi:peptidoglycan/LPS O-acetylase OafA/YrhL